MPSAFALPASSPKAEPNRIAADDKHFAAIAATLQERIATLTADLTAARTDFGRYGHEALHRDDTVRHYSAQLQRLRRFGSDICLGRMTFDDTTTSGTADRYIGRAGLATPDGTALVVDWRSPEAAPYFSATRAAPLGVRARRRYRWSLGQVVDYWDESLTATGDDATALDAESAFIASLGAARTGRMREVLGTLAADQDAIIRHPAGGALVVDGGPGTGKTVVALHRAAYLIYHDPRLRPEHGGVLVVGPHREYLTYVGDVLPNLGEHGVVMATVNELVPEGAHAAAESNPAVRHLKSSGRLVDAIDTAVRFYEEPPQQAMTVETPWVDLRVTARDWARAFAAPDDGTPHNEARAAIWDELLDILGSRVPEASQQQVREALRRNPELVQAVHSAWPMLDAADVVRDLWTVPAYLRLAAPWLTSAEVTALRRDPASPWTLSDLPLLDAARHRLGDAAQAAAVQQEAAVLAAERERTDRVVEELVAADDDFEGPATMLLRDDMRNSLDDFSGLDTRYRDRLAGPFAHIIVDEAQELTAAEWTMLRRRCPRGSFTIVGDRAQSRAGFPESWQERLTAVGLRRISVRHLTVNYRTPAEVMQTAAPQIQAALPDANVPQSIRRSGIPVRQAPRGRLDSLVRTWLRGHAQGTVGIISAAPRAKTPTAGEIPAGTALAQRHPERVAALTADTCKGLEFDLVMVVEPDTFGTDLTAAVDRYVAMTRATRELVILR